MAQNATNHNLGRAGRVIRHLIPSRRNFAILVAVEIALTLMGLPLGAHLALGLAIHVIIDLLGDPSKWRFRAQ